MSAPPLIRGYEVVIGIETHAQLSTRSKIFSGASTAFGAAPNTQASAVDLALPGTLPVANRGAVERAIRFGLAVGATVAPLSIFARKNYFYPDLPKGYQISQYDQPLCSGGSLSFGLTAVTPALTSRICAPALRWASASPLTVSKLPAIISAASFLRPVGLIRSPMMVNGLSKPMITCLFSDATSV